MNLFTSLLGTTSLVPVKSALLVRFCAPLNIGSVARREQPKKVKMALSHQEKLQPFIKGRESLTYSYLETCKRVIGKQCRPRSDAT